MAWIAKQTTLKKPFQAERASKLNKKIRASEMTKPTTATVSAADLLKSQGN